MKGEIIITKEQIYKELALFINKQLLDKQIITYELYKLAETSILKKDKSIGSI